MSDITEEIDNNLLCDEAVQHPHRYFERLRNSDPVHWNPRHKAWVLTRYDQVSTELRTNQLTAERITPFTEAVTRAANSQDVDATFEILRQWLVFKDPPEHTRLRRLVARAFTPTMVRARTEEITETITGLVDDLRERDSVDLINEFAFPLPAVVIAQMLGVPPEDRNMFKEWSDQLTALVFGAYGSEDRFESAARGMIDLRDYLLDLIAHYEKQPGENLISVLLEHEDDDALSREELVATCTLLLFGGHETTTNLIGNGMLALMTNPDQLALLHSQPDLIGSAIEEILRFDGPARATVRMVKENHEVDGRMLSEGERVFLINLSANRDPEMFEDPDSLRIERNPGNHLGFGVGIHYCLGAPLARLEGKLAISHLLDAFPDITLDADPSSLAWHQTMLSRGLVKLPVNIRP
jgi:cytochrome P450